MTIAVHYFIDFVNLQSVCKSTDKLVFKFIDSSCQNTDFHSPSVFKKTCTKHNSYSCCNMLVKILLKNPFQSIVLVTSICIKNILVQVFSPRLL